MEGGHYSNFQKISNFKKFSGEVEVLVEDWLTTNAHEGAKQFLTEECSQQIENHENVENLAELKTKLKDEDSIKAAKAVINV